eukprot:1160897-Pelagomonas_calceolata.AAC.4
MHSWWRVAGVLLSEGLGVALMQIKRGVAQFQMMRKAFVSQSPSDASGAQLAAHGKGIPVKGVRCCARMVFVSVTHVYFGIA